jgi:L-threonylcarbamoyladenylate synthase
VRYSDAVPEIARIDPGRPAPEVLARAAEVLRAGHLVAYPTETFYGLACDPRHADAIEAVYAAKGRPDRLALPLLAADAASLVSFTAPPGEGARRLMEAFWPGPLTLVLEASADVPPRLLGGGHTVGVRVSPHPVAAGLARAFGSPIVATSANRSGEPPPGTAREVEEGLGENVHLILDGGPTRGGSASTVLDLTREPPHLVRSGAVSAAAVEAALGRRLA